MGDNKMQEYETAGTNNSQIIASALLASEGMRKWNECMAQNNLRVYNMWNMGKIAYEYEAPFVFSGKSTHRHHLLPSYSCAI